MLTPFNSVIHFQGSKLRKEVETLAKIYEKKKASHNIICNKQQFESKKISNNEKEFNYEISTLQNTMEALKAYL